MAEAKTKETTAPQSKEDPVLKQVLERLDNLEQSNQRLEADNTKLKTENETLLEKSKENADLKSRLDDMDKQVKSINVAEKLTEEQKRELWKSMREDNFKKIRQADGEKFYVHTANGKPITDKLIKDERKKAGKA